MNRFEIGNGIEELLKEVEFETNWERKRQAFSRLANLYGYMDETQAKCYLLLSEEFARTMQPLLDERRFWKRPPNATQ